MVISLKSMVKGLKSIVIGFESMVTGLKLRLKVPTYGLQAVF